MAAPPDPSTDAFLYLVDALDAEANAVTHAVVRAQATVRSIVDDARTLVDQPNADERAWAEVGVRLMQHRAVLVDALATLCRSGSERPANGQAPLIAMSTPVPPRSIPRPDAASHADERADRPSATVDLGKEEPPTGANQPGTREPAPTAEVPAVELIAVPEPPRARHRPVPTGIAG